METIVADDFFITTKPPQTYITRTHSFSYIYISPSQNTRYGIYIGIRFWQQFILSLSVRTYVVWLRHHAIIYIAQPSINLIIIFNTTKQSKQ